MPTTTAVLAPLLMLMMPAGASRGVEPVPDWRGTTAFQVRIERRSTIRVSPRAPSQPTRPNLLLDWPGPTMEPRVFRRRIGKCLPMAGIAGVQAESGRTLLLFMRDRRVISAELERACRARDFYSGFYLAATEDGQLCVDRDSLQSRSGVSCQIKGIRELVLMEE